MSNEHDHAAGLKTGKIQPGRESKMRAYNKNSRTNKNLNENKTEKKELNWVKFTSILGNFTSTTAFESI